MAFLSCSPLPLEFSSFMKKFVASFGFGLEEMELSSMEDDSFTVRVETEDDELLMYFLKN